MGLKDVLGTAKDCGAVIKWAVISRTCFLVLQVAKDQMFIKSLASTFCPEA